MPTMAEINPWNGHMAASSFSGCDASSLGYRMARFRMAVGIRVHRGSPRRYHANFPDAIIDERDIRDVDPQDQLDMLGARRQ